MGACFDFSVPLIYVTIPPQTLHYIEYWSYVVRFNIRYSDSSRFILFQDSLSYSRACAFPYEFQKQFYVYTKTCLRSW